MLYLIYLAAWFILPLFLCAVILVAWRDCHPAVGGGLWLVASVVGTILLANYVWALDAHLLAEIDKYEPGSPEAERAQREWASDTGRSFTLLISPVLTGGWYALVFVLFFLRHQFFGKPHSRQSAFPAG